MAQRHHHLEARGVAVVGGFEALMSSVYTRRDGRWRLALYQQTPTPAA